MSSGLLGRVMPTLAKHRAFISAKERLRPVKHVLFGVNDIYHVVNIVQQARGVANPVRVVFDVGAERGEKSLALLRAFPQSDVYCFEPRREAFLAMQKRVASFGERAKPYNLGFYSHACQTEITVCSHGPASSLLGVSPLLKTQGKTEIGRETITVRTLDDFVKEKGLSRIDFLKIDVEGVEKELLLGATVALERIENIFVEIGVFFHKANSRDHIDVFDLLQRAGFTFMGAYEDFFFSKDPAVLGQFFDGATK
jgi:FkbM family methyltransferase